MNWLQDILADFSFRVVLDILLVSFLIYQLIMILKGTRAAQILIGLAVIFIGYSASSMLRLETINWIIGKFYSSFFIVFIILFQDDIRRILTRFGRSPFIIGVDENPGLRMLNEIISTAKYLSHDRLGAIIVFERGIGLERIYDHATPLDSVVSEQLLISIFQSFSPLHDGAVIIRKNRVLCASAQLPLTKNPLMSKKLGTRHSAALGVSEETDAVVLVISEETGAISIAWDGHLQRKLSLEAARRILISLLLPQSNKKDAIEKVDYQSNSLAFLVRVGRYLGIRIGYLGKERRKNHGDRRTQQQRNDIEYEIERQNRLAAKDGKMQIRFPSYAKIKMAEVSSKGVVISKAAADEVPVIDSFEHDAESVVDTPTETPDLDTITERVNAHELKPEDKFEPPMIMLPPPVDVSIAGIPLEAPSDDVKSTGEEKS